MAAEIAYDFFVSYASTTTPTAGSMPSSLT